MSVPSNRMLPLDARSWPEIRLKYVVLPAPFGPTIAVSSPGRKLQVTLLTATWPPKRMVRSRVSRVSVMGLAVMRGELAGDHVARPPPLAGEAEAAYGRRS